MNHRRLAGAAVVTAVAVALGFEILDDQGDGLR